MGRPVAPMVPTYIQAASSRDEDQTQVPRDILIPRPKAVLSSSKKDIGHKAQHQRTQDRRIHSDLLQDLKNADTPNPISFTTELTSSPLLKKSFSCKITTPEVTIRNGAMTKHPSNLGLPVALLAETTSLSMWFPQKSSTQYQTSKSFSDWTI